MPTSRIAIVPSLPRAVAVALRIQDEHRIAAPCLHTGDTLRDDAERTYSPLRGLPLSGLALSCSVAARDGDLELTFSCRGERPRAGTSTVKQNDVLALYVAGPRVAVALADRLNAAPWYDATSGRELGRVNRDGIDLELEWFPRSARGIDVVATDPLLAADPLSRVLRRFVFLPLAWFEGFAELRFRVPWARANDASPDDTAYAARVLAQSLRLDVFPFAARTLSLVSGANLRPADSAGRLVLEEAASIADRAPEVRLLGGAHRGDKARTSFVGSAWNTAEGEHVRRLSIENAGGHGEVVTLDADARTDLWIVRTCRAWSDTGSDRVTWPTQEGRVHPVPLESQLVVPLRPRTARVQNVTDVRTRIAVATRRFDFLELCERVDPDSIRIELETEGVFRDSTVHVATVDLRFRAGRELAEGWSGGVVAELQDHLRSCLGINDRIRVHLRVT